MGEMVFRYCERGLAIGIAAEPFNVASNGAFFVVAWLIWRDRTARRDTLVALGTAAVGAGSTLFHALATRGAELADVVPIAVLMALLAWIVLTEVVRLPQRRALFCLVGLGAAMAAAGVIVIATGCDRPLIVATASRLSPNPLACLNGSWTYMPGAVALWLIAGFARYSGSVAARWLAVAALAFTLALAARTLDLTWCGALLGLHAFWHVGAAATVYALTRAITAVRRKPRAAALSRA